MRKDIGTIMSKRFFKVFEYESSSLVDGCILYHNVTFINDVTANTVDGSTQIKTGAKFSQCFFQVIFGKLVTSDGRTINLEHCHKLLQEHNRCDKCGGPL